MVEDYITLRISYRRFCSSADRGKPDLFQVALKGVYDLLHEGVDDGVDALVPLYLGMDDSLVLKDGEMLRNHRLRLLEADPEFAYAGLLLFGDRAQEL